LLKSYYVHPFGSALYKLRFERLLMSTNSPLAGAVSTLAKDLSVEFPRSPRETLGGYIIAGRALDKCRAELNNTAGEYHFNCPLDKLFFEFTGIDADDFKAMVATGASDEAVSQWVALHSKQTEHIAVVKWNNLYRYMTPREMPDKLQLYMEDYIPQFIPASKVVHYWFDVYDIEEKRL
jgi:hypothetical protein